MRFGLYLRGGGAKGAFQAGLLCAFWQRGVQYSVIGGTSIGAVNGWFVLHNAYEEMKEFYLHMDQSVTDMKASGSVINNSLLVKKLQDLQANQDSSVEAFYVNYCPVQNGTLREKVEDLKGTDEAYAISRIGWSALLPYNLPEMDFAELKRYMDHTDLSLKFQEDLDRHVYDGLHLDGGLLNNLLIRNVLDHNCPRLLVLGYEGSREEYLESLGDLPVSDRERILYLASDEPFDGSDTYNFTPEFLKRRFSQGYDKGMSFPLIKLISG
ncbi:hypothetical protein ABB02_00484 [Clostridiaceae bacterium JG1575]|nr:hypothetical protein ABB02_00484 [Clostridiaceae bacterium JG1575]